MAKAPAWSSIPGAAKASSSQSSTSSPPRRVSTSTCATAATAELAAALLEEGANSPADVFYAQDPGGLGAVEAPGCWPPLPQATLAKVNPFFVPASGAWVGISGRARVVVYNSDLLSEADLPADISGFTDPQWQGRIGWAPTNGSFQAMVTAMRAIWGESATAAWLSGIQANNPVVYSGNTPIVEGVAAGEVDVGFVNHYYLFRFLSRGQGETFPARNYFLPGGGPGSLLMVSGAGILKSAANGANAQRFIDYLLSETGQQYFTDETFEYPVIDGVAPRSLLAPLETLTGLAATISLTGPGRPAGHAGSPAAAGHHRIGWHGLFDRHLRSPAQRRHPAPAPGAPAAKSFRPAAPRHRRRGGFAHPDHSRLPHVRMAGSGAEVVDLLLQARTLTTLGNTVALAAAVTAASAVIAVPVAWLTTCTDLPGRRVLGLAAALPLVLPSYVAAYLYASLLAPRGALQQLLAPLTGIERLPDFYGFRGAFFVLTLVSYPYVLLTVRAALQRMDPALVEAARSLGLSAARRLLPGYAALSAPLADRRRAAGGPLLSARLRCGDAAAVQHVYARHLQSLPGLPAGHGGGAGAGADPAHGPPAAAGDTHAAGGRAMRGFRRAPSAGRRP